MLKQTIQTETPPPHGAYSQGFCAGDLLITPSTRPWHPVLLQVVGPTIEEQIVRALKNLQEMLEIGVTSLCDVINTIIHFNNLDQFTAFIQIFTRYFLDPKMDHAMMSGPRACILFEIDAVANLGN